MYWEYYFTIENVLVTCHIFKYYKGEIQKCGRAYNQHIIFLQRRYFR